MQLLKVTALWAIVAITATNAYFTYRSALVYEKMPVHSMTNEQFSTCLTAEAEGIGQYKCPYEWHLKGTD